MKAVLNAINVEGASTNPVSVQQRVYDLVFPQNLNTGAPGPSISKNLIWIRMIRIL